MTLWHAWLVDSDGDGIPDDFTRRFVLAPPDGTFRREEVAALLDLAATIGLHAGALPLPLFVVDRDAPDAMTITSGEQIRELLSVEPDAQPELSEVPIGACLSRFFSPEGVLSDRDGDLVADGSRVSFLLPETLPAALAASLANLASRIGLESGGVDLPLCRDDGNVRVIPGHDAAELVTTDDGWEARGNAEQLAELIDAFSQQWPHLTIPEAGGIGYSLGWLRRALAGDGPEPRPAGHLLWEMQWLADWEVDRIWAAFERDVLPNLNPGEPVQVTAFASESPDIRHALGQRMAEAVQARGAKPESVHVLSTFKAGLSWLRDVVIPGLAGQSITSVRITYRPFASRESSLDGSTRWLQELFPGDEILARDLGLEIDQIVITEGAPGGPTFTAEAIGPDCAVLGFWELSLLTGTWPFVQSIVDSGTVEVTTSGIMATQPSQRIVVSVASDLESFWSFWQQEVLPRVIQHIDMSGGARRELQPFFGRLEAEVWISEPNNRLDIREENDSAAEALHEDIYFNTLDAIEMYGERTTGERTSAPGAVVPIVHVEDGTAPRASVRLYAPPEIDRTLPYPDLRVARITLENGELVPHIGLADGAPGEPTRRRLDQLAASPTSVAGSVRVRISTGMALVDMRLPLQPVLSAGTTQEVAPPMDVNIYGDEIVALTSRLAGLPGIRAWIEDESYEGRAIPAIAIVPDTPGRLRSPSKYAALRPTALIVARHHANEISSTNAAFNLLWRCATDPDWRALCNSVNIVVIPYENPDGAALHARLASDPAARNWKHHPARYNALGTEFSQEFFNPDTRFGESRVRPALWRRFLPDAIVDNHGVPSHEWVQPFAGFGSPPRFRVSYWIPQALLYGIIGYVDAEEYPEHHAMAKALRDAVSRAVKDTDIGALNEEIGRSYRTWGQQRDPERFPGTFHDGMLWHIAGSPPDPEGRGFSSRFPGTTVLNWVTEVNDETAEGDHLERTARAHLLANRAMLDLLAEAAALPEVAISGGSLRWARRRPLNVRSDPGNR